MTEAHKRAAWHEEENARHHQMLQLHDLLLNPGNSSTVASIYIDVCSSAFEQSAIIQN